MKRWHGIGGTGLGFLALMCVGYFLVGCEEEEIFPEDTFVKLYGSSGQERAIDFLETDAGFVILGQTNSLTLMADVPSAETLTTMQESAAEGDLIEDLDIPPLLSLVRGGNEVDYFVIFTDEAGNQISRVSFSQILSDVIQNNILADSEDIPAAIIRTDDDNYLIVGTSTYAVQEQRIASGADVVRQSDFFVVKFNAAGEVLFQKVYGDTFYALPGTDELTEIANEQAADVAEVPDGYLILGTTDRVDREKDYAGASAADDRTDFYITKISKDGTTTIWTRVRGFPETETAVAISPISCCSSYSIIMASSTKIAQAPRPGAGGTNVLFAQLDPLGEIGSAGYFGFDGDEQPQHMLRTADGIFYVVGTYSEAGKKDKAFIFEITEDAKLRFSGNVNQPPSIGPAEDSAGEEDIEGMDAIQIPGVGYFVVGSIAQFSDDSGSKGAEMLLMRTDLSGVIDRGFGDNTIGGLSYGGREDDRLVRILRLESNHLMLLGTLGFGGGSTMISLLKVNASGKFQKL